MHRINSRKYWQCKCDSHEEVQTSSHGYGYSLIKGENAKMISPHSISTSWQHADALLTVCVAQLVSILKEWDWSSEVQVLTNCSSMVTL